ncbi:MAG TPA: hypothetical protein VK063_09125 [Beutenbergiaceae bacterium]|nr:hypothetical protein [Beutenbergiaceae bacterium]
MSTPDDSGAEEHHRATNDDPHPVDDERGADERPYREDGELANTADDKADDEVDRGADDGAHDAAQVPFTERHRTAVGIAVVVLCLVVAAFFAVVGPAGAEASEPWGPILRWAAPVLWVGLAAVAGAWTAGVRRTVVNRMAGVLLLAYVAYLVVRMF